MLLTDKIVSVTDFRKDPMQGNKQDLLCVLKNSKPEFYCIDPVRLAELLRKEKKSDKVLTSLADSLLSMHEGGLINWAVMDTLLSKVRSMEYSV